MDAKLKIEIIWAQNLILLHNTISSFHLHFCFLLRRSNITCWINRLLSVFQVIWSQIKTHFCPPTVYTKPNTDTNYSESSQLSTTHLEDRTHPLSLLLSVSFLCDLKMLFKKWTFQISKLFFYLTQWWGQS